MEWHDGQSVSILTEDNLVRYIGKATWLGKQVFYVSDDNSYKTLGGFKVKTGEGNCHDVYGLRAVPRLPEHKVDHKFVLLDIIKDVRWSELPVEVLEQIHALVTGAQEGVAK